jgi:hypothetical protein
MDNLATYIFLGILMLLVVRLMVYMRKNQKVNDLGAIFRKLSKEGYSIIEDARIALSEQVKFFVDGVILSRYGIFVILHSNLRGQLEGDDQSEMIRQVIGRHSYQVKSPMLLLNKLSSYFQKYMDIDEAYLKPILVFDRQAVLRFDKMTTQYMKMAALIPYIESNEEMIIPEPVLNEIKAKFGIVEEKPVSEEEVQADTEK